MQPRSAGTIPAAPPPLALMGTSGRRGPAPARARARACCRETRVGRRALCIKAAVTSRGSRAPGLRGGASCRGGAGAEDRDRAREPEPRGGAQVTPPPKVGAGGSGAPTNGRAAGPASGGGARLGQPCSARPGPGLQEAACELASLPGRRCSLLLLTRHPHGLLSPHCEIPAGAPRLARRTPPHTTRRRLHPLNESGGAKAGFHPESYPQLSQPFHVKSEPSP